jgi:iron complex outermembrane receptor protein
MIDRSKIRLSAALLLGLSAITTAQGAEPDAEQPESEQSETFGLGVVERILVTADGNRFGPAYPGVEPITAEDMIRHERHDATEALALLPGVMVENIGNRNERVVFVRGFDSRQVPVYIDGIPVYIPWNGSIDLSRFTTFDLSSILVTKSFTSVLYGPNTLGGSINLVSRRPRDQLEAEFSAGMGFDADFGKNFHRVSANIGGNFGTWYYQAGASLRDRDEFTPSNDYNPSGAEDGGARENSYYKDTKVSLKIGFTPNETDEYAISYSKQDGEKGTPPYGGTDPSVRLRYWQWPYYDKESLYFLSRTAFGDGHYVRFRAYYDEFDNLLSSFDNDSYTTQNRGFAFNSTYDDHAYGGGTEFGFKINEAHTLAIAANAKFDIHEEQDDFGEPWEKFKDETYSIAAENIWTFSERTTVITGVSWNKQESTRADQVLPDFSIVPFPTGSDSAFNAQIGWFLELSEALALRASAGHKTRFPTISNRFSARFGSALPNPDLSAETSDNYEIGLDGRAGRLSYGGALFLSQIDDAIVSASIDDALCSSPPCSQNRNVEKQENKGLELYAKFDFSPTLNLHLDYTYLDRKNKSNPGIRLIDAPKHKAFAYLVYNPVEALELIASVNYEGSRLNETDGSRGVGSFTVANLKASWNLSARLRAEFGVNNVLDENYAYDEGYPEPGRNFILNLRYRY